MKKLCSYKNVVITTGFLLAAIIGHSTNYYSKTSGNANTPGTWGVNSNGTGAAPSNFTTSGDIFILSSGCTLGLSGNWTIGTGVTLRIDGNINVTTNNFNIKIKGIVIFTSTNTTQVSLTGGGNGNDFKVNSGATLKTANQNGIRGTNCSLPATASGTITLNAGGTYELNGTGNQSLTGLPATVANLNINNSAGTTLTGSTTVTNTVTLSSGILNIPAGITLTLSSPIAIAGSGFGASKHINTQVSGASQGFLRVNSITAAYTFPVGNGTYYLPATVTPASSSDFSVNTFVGLTTNGAPNGTAMTTQEKKNAVDAVWRVDRPTGSGNATLTVNWNAALEGAGFATLAGSSIGISHGNGSYWDVSVGSGDNTANTATRNSISSFSPFGVGMLYFALPIKFGNVKVSQQQQNIKVDWTSLTEINVNRYEIERSADGRSFTGIGQVPATGNNYSKSDYSWLDMNSLPGTSFYRIKAVDIDGKINYSSIVRITTGLLVDQMLSVYPNPSTDKKITIQVGNINAGLYNLSIYDMNGREVYRQSIDHAGGAFSQSIQLPATISKGVFNTRLCGKEMNLVRSFLLQ